MGYVFKDGKVVKAKKITKLSDTQKEKIMTLTDRQKATISRTKSYNFKFDA